MIRIAVDLNGGDLAPDSILKGCSDFLQNFDDVSLILVSTDDYKDKILNYLPKLKDSKIIYCNSSVDMSDSPLAVKLGRDVSTIVKCMDLVKCGRADVVFSAGNSGASVLSAIDILGIEKDSVPMLLSLVPIFQNGKKRIIGLSDSGATGNKHAKESMLLKFAEESAEFFKSYCNISNPKIGLLNIGEEKSKGPSEYRKAYESLKKSDMDFIGNVEADSFFLSDADIIVTDGFTGNIILKFVESFELLLSGCDISAKDENLKKFFEEEFKYDNIGGAPLLGVNGKVVIGHGKSNDKAVYSALKFCRSYSI